MLRRYWLLSALLDRQWGSRRGSGGTGDPQDWHASLGRLAVATPELGPSSGSAIEAARTEGELAPQLRTLGPCGQLQHLQGAWVALVLLVLVRTRRILHGATAWLHMPQAIWHESLSMSNADEYSHTVEAWMQVLLKAWVACCMKSLPAWRRTWQQQLHSI